MRTYLAALLFLALASSAHGVVVNITAQTGGDSGWWTLPEGAGSLKITGDTDGGACVFQVRKANNDPLPVVSYNESEVAAGISREIRHGAGEQVQVSCSGATSMTVSIGIWPLRMPKGTGWVYRYTSDYDRLHCPDGCTVAIP